MDVSLITALLRCPKCGSDFVIGEDKFDCKAGHSFRFQNNVVDFSGTKAVDPVQKRSERSFQVEWTQYYPSLGWKPNELAIEKDMFLTCTRAMPSFFSNNIVIDAGCGNGRYINVLNRLSSPPPKLILGIDISDTVLVAAKNCSIFQNVLFLKMDLNLVQNILKEPVDYIYSIGVLHHTPNAEEAFHNLVKCIKKGGFMSVYLYGKGNPILHRVNCFLRNRFFQRWPHQLVYCMCFLIAIPCQVFRIKFFGPWLQDFVSRFIFISYDVHNMFDAYTAGYTSYHERREVEQWYAKAGFDCVVESQHNRTNLFCIGRAQ
jgi:SAM-dependent methyltransferase